MALLGWMLVGLAIGGLFHMLAPRRAAGGSIVPLLLGIAGAMLGGFLARALAVAAAGDARSYLAAAAGAITLVLVYRLTLRRR